MQIGLILQDEILVFGNKNDLYDHTQNEIEIQIHLGNKLNSLPLWGI